MSRLLTSQINRAIFRVMGLDKFQLQEFEDHSHEITFEWDLELMEKYDDFKYLLRGYVPQSSCPSEHA